MNKIFSFKSITIHDSAHLLIPNIPLVWSCDLVAAASHPATQHRGAALLSGGRRLLEHANARLAQEVHLQGNTESSWYALASHFQLLDLDSKYSSHSIDLNTHIK